MTDLQFDLSEENGTEPAAFKRRLDAARLQDLLAGCATLTAPVELALSARRQGGQVVFSGSARGEWELPCVRCLGPARAPFRAALEGEAPLSGATFDATEGLRQALHLALPLGPRCRPDCRGLCPECGADRNQGTCGCRPDEFAARRNDA
ncbi:MAG: DUF177 domain-containing protein [Elusimicrobia bacterium]|nr:DUF177 domain-containing protein [Elusimicrobiota bacterium]